MRLSLGAFTGTLLWSDVSKQKVRKPLVHRLFGL